MKKHIKVHAKLTENNTKVLLTLLECSHLGSEFGSFDAPHKWYLSPSYGTFWVGRVRMYCTDNPKSHDLMFRVYDKFDTDHKNSDICLRVGVSGTKTKIPIKYWPRVKAAIEAYNEWGNSINHLKGEPDMSVIKVMPAVAKKGTCTTCKSCSCGTRNFGIKKPARRGPRRK